MIRRVILLVGSCVMLAAVSGFGSDLWGRNAEADLRPHPKYAKIDAPEHIARNTVEGEAIPVCTNDYPNAVAAWNEGLRNKAPQPYIAPGASVFEVTASCGTAPSTGRIDHIEVVALPVGDNNLFCPTFNGCSVWPVRSGAPLYTYQGPALIIINETLRPKMYDMLKDAVIPGVLHPDYLAILRTMTHEIGHTLGFGHYPAPFDDSIMSESHPWTRRS